MKLADKAVFITGGAQGFGRAVAEEVLKRGAKVFLADVKADRGEATAVELKRLFGQNRVSFMTCDVSNAASLERTFKTAVARYGHIDIVCNNAGIMNDALWEKQIAINFNAVVRGTTLAIEHMRKDKGGKGGVIINTASIAGLVPNYYLPVYSATKSAVKQFTLCWAMNPEMQQADIRFVSICPSAVRTALMDFEDDAMINPAEFRDTMEKLSFCAVEQVVQAFLMAMEDDSTNGALVCITPRRGVVRMTEKLVPVAAKL